MRVYLSNIRGAWPISRQEQVLDAAVPGWRKGTVYHDDLTLARRKVANPADLIERGNMLRPTSRQGGETIHMASLSVFAWSLPDFLNGVAAAVGRQATLVALDEDVSIPPTAGAVEIAAAGEAFLSACRRGQTQGGREAGVRRSAEVRSAKAKEGCERIRDRWVQPTEQFSTSALLDEAGVSRPTAEFYLGKRPEAQRKFRHAQATAARNRSRKKRA